MRMCPQCKETYFKKTTATNVLLADPLEGMAEMDFLDELKENQRKDRKRRLDDIQIKLPTYNFPRQ